MKKSIICAFTTLQFLATSTTAIASLTTIGTATYEGNAYSLIWDNDNNGKSLVWLDYSNPGDIWDVQTDWVASLGGQITVALLPGYTSTINWNEGWRLPSSGDTPYAGWNRIDSEMGHLYYDEFKLPGNGQDRMSEDDLNFSNFDHLVAAGYWSSTEEYWAGQLTSAWYFTTRRGYQSTSGKQGIGYGIAVQSGFVDGPIASDVPIPAAAWLLGSGLVGLITFRKKRKL